MENAGGCQRRRVDCERLQTRAGVERCAVTTAVKFVNQGGGQTKLQIGCVYHTVGEYPTSNNPEWCRASSIELQMHGVGGRGRAQ